MSDITKMPRGMLQNEINMAMREASTMAMIESQKKKKEADARAAASVVSVNPPQLTQVTPQEVTCVAVDNSVGLVCTLVLAILLK